MAKVNDKSKQPNDFKEVILNPRFGLSKDGKYFKAVIELVVIKPRAYIDKILEGPIE